jgi:hypothetical protein
MRTRVRDRPEEFPAAAARADAVIAGQKVVLKD